MKLKITTLFLVLSQLTFGQNYGYEENENNFFADNLISFIFGYILIALIIIIASYIETQKKTKALHRNEIQKGLIPLVIFSFLGFLLLFAWLNNESELAKFIPFLAIIIKFVMASITSNNAEKLGRNKTLWWILGFLEYHTSLIILAIRPAIVKVNTENENRINILNSDFKLKETNLIALQKANLLNESEFENKLSEIKKNYFNELENVTIEDTEEKNVVKNDEIIEKLNKAYKDGLFTSDEFEKKLNELKNNNNS